jgi:serine/threonine-protein kinase
VERKLGEGAASTLWAVRDQKTNQVYALKHVNRKTDKDVRFIEQLENEFAVSKQFTHPVLRKAVDLKYSKSLFFKVTAAALIMEMVDGTPLDKQPPSDIPETVWTFIQVGKGLDAMHFLGYVHCDMKPGNILTGENGLVKLIDFGQAAKIATVKERIQGTPDFIAPEQVEKRPVTVRTDVFNFGATLYWALCGHKIPTMFTVKKAKRDFMRDEHVKPLTVRDPKIPQALSDLVMECIRLDPTQRPRSMDVVVKGLEGMK